MESNSYQPSQLFSPDLQIEGIYGIRLRAQIWQLPFSSRMKPRCFRASRWAGTGATGVAGCGEKGIV